MKIFFDENLSFKLPELLKVQYPNSIHARDAGLRGVTDKRIWNYCKENGFIIAFKDTDFRELSFVKGNPPKVIWLEVGNAGTKPIAELLQNNHQRIKRFVGQPESSLLILSISAGSL